MPMCSASDTYSMDARRAHALSSTGSSGPAWRTRGGQRMSSPVETLVNREYKYGFVTDIESDVAPRGLNEDIIRLISAKKGEPKWLLHWRLKAFRGWSKMSEPHSWPNIKYNPVDYQRLRYYAAPKTKMPLGSLDE